MRFLLFLVGCVSLAQGLAPNPGGLKGYASSGITVICHTSQVNPSGGAASVTTGAINCTGANVCFAGVDGFAQKMTTTVTITDSTGANTWQFVPNALSAANLDVGLSYSVVTSVSSSMTFTASGGSYTPIAVMCINDPGGTPGVSDGNNVNGNYGTGCSATTTCQTASVTPSANNEILVSIFGSDTGNVSSISGGGYSTILENVTRTGNSESIGLAYVIQTTAAASQPTWTASASGNMEAMQNAFK